MGVESLGSFGRLLAQAFTFHESIQISRDFISTYNSGQQIWIERHGDQVQYCQKLVGSLPQDRIREVVHLGLANALAVGGVARGTDWRPTRIELATDPIDMGAYVPEFADIPISFNQPHTSLWFEQRWLSEPLPAFDSSNCPFADANERASFVATSPAADPIGQLEQVIESTLGNPEMNVQFIATTIGTSARTLQRRLAEHDASFSRLLQAVRFRNSQRLLRDLRMPLTDIAKRLGYTDRANFIRAFKRWAGVGPNEFRRLHCEYGLR
jgi:AraC-like DNA-binding protein